MDEFWMWWQTFSAEILTEKNLVIVSSVSLFMFVASIAIIPWFISRLPANYFVTTRKPLANRIRESSVGTAMLLILKNSIGVLLFLAGTLMLVLPGQGLLTILVSIILMDFPRKKAIEERIIRTKGVKKSADWLRNKYGKEPFQLRSKPRRS